jgi:hypothetical protein
MSSESFYEASLPIYYFLKIFGLAPFSFQGPIKHGNLVIKIYDKLWVFSILCFHGVAIWGFSRVTPILLKYESTVFLSMNWMICFGYGIITKLVIVVNIYWKRENVVRFWKIIGSFYGKVRDNFVV